MSSLRCAIAALALISSLSPSASLAEPHAPHFQRVQTTDTREFNDPIYGYSVRFPASWKPLSRDSKSEPPSRLALYTPDKGILIISVHRLRRAVTVSAKFEQIGHDYVDPVVKVYLESLNITMILGSQKRDHSDDRSMRFWQGTSAVNAVLVSLHAIQYGSDFMVNIVYASGNKPNLKDEIRALDALMNSLSFTHR